MNNDCSRSSRRDFLAAGTAAATSCPVLTAFAGNPQPLSAKSVHVEGRETVRVGLVGCGGRGTHAVQQAMNTESNVELVAVADVFQNRLDQCLDGVNEQHPGKMKVDGNHRFLGFDGFRRVLDSSIDMVFLVTPPGFRPLHFEAAVDAGKHVFMEKPVAVDVPGIRRVLKANEIARRKNLAVAVGLQRRHEVAYQETIEQLRSGIIGDPVASRVYWNSGCLWNFPRQPDDTELSYQMRNWYYFNWICGDHIVEQHIHNMDVINWLLDDFPVSAIGMGGRQVRTGSEFGQIFDHHMVEYTYANGHKMISQCRQIDDCWNSVSEYVHGTKGHAEIHRGRIFSPTGEKLFQSEGSRGGHQQEHHDLFLDLRNGVIPNEGEYGAKSTMTAIMGRMATYTGREIRLADAMQSEISLCDFDSLKSMSDEAPVKPDSSGNYPVPMPGRDLDKIIDF